MSETTTVAETEAPASEAPASEAPAESAWAGPDADAPATTTAEAAPPAPPAEPPAPVPAAPAAKPRRSVAVPMWLLGLLAAGVVVVGAFFVGRESAPTTSGSSGPTTLAQAVEETAKGDLPVGDFNVQDLIAALQQNGNLNLNLQDILDLLGGNR